MEYTSEFNKTSIMLAGVGAGRPSRWLYSEYGNFLSAFNYVSGIEVVFNLSSVTDIQRKLEYIYQLRDQGKCSIDDVSELEERLRTLSSLSTSGKDRKSLAGLYESTKRAKGSKYVTYSDGVKKEHIARGSSKKSTDAQKRAAENARKYAWTESARKKRRKSISARGDGKIMKEI